jgi:hypothetical protein
MRFRALSRDPFTDIGRTIPEFSSVGLAESKESHGFSVGKKNVFEIDITMLILSWVTSFFGRPSLSLPNCAPSGATQQSRIE